MGKVVAGALSALVGACRGRYSPGHGRGNADRWSAPRAAVPHLCTAVREQGLARFVRGSAQVAGSWTASAATGSVVGVVLLDSTHWKFIGAAFDPSQIFFTFLLAAISFTLIGPGEEFGCERERFGAWKGEEPHSLLEQAISGSSLRAIGRFILVGLAWVLLDMVHGIHVDATVRAARGRAIAIEPLFGSVPPAIIDLLLVRRASARCTFCRQDQPGTARSWRATGLLFAMGAS